MRGARTIPEQICDLVESLPPLEQESMLAFARALAQNRLPPGTPGNALLRFAGVLPRETVASIESAVEDCEGIE